MSGLYEFIASPNFTRRTARNITAVVIHYTGSMNIEGTIAWFKRPDAKVSAHYVIGVDGRTVQMVEDNDIAWHAGRSAMRPKETPPGEPDVNRFSLGIELVGTHDSGFTDRQLAALYALLERIVAKYRVTPERIVGHLHIAPGRKIDPDGYRQQFPWAKVRAVAQTTWNAVQGGRNG